MGDLREGSSGSKPFSKTTTSGLRFRALLIKDNASLEQVEFLKA